MKHLKIYLIAFLVTACQGVFAQYISMNTSGAAGSPSAILDLSANPNLGFLMPAVTFTSSIDATTIPSPAQGLIVYNPTTSTSNGLFGPGFYYWTGSQWNYLYNNGTGPDVTSVGLVMPSIFSVSGSPVTSSGTLGVSLVNQNANLIFAGPASGSPAAPAFRALTVADLPTLIPNSALANSSITFTGTGVTFSPSGTVALGGTITITGSGGTVTSVAPGTEGGTASGSSGLTLTPNSITNTGTIALAALPISPAGTYTSTTQVPVITVNAEGQVTNVTQTALTNTGTVTSVGAGTPGAAIGTSGLTFSANPITSTGNIAIATGGITNAMLANNSVTINTTAPLTGGGTVPLGGSITLGLTTPLAYNYGGTGTGTAPIQYGVIYSPDGSTYTSTSAGTSGQVLTGNGVAAPTFQSFASSVGGTYIENQTTVQSPGNYWIQPAAAGNVGGVIQAASGQTADLLDFNNSSATPVAHFDNNGNLTNNALTSVGMVNINTTATGGVTTIGAGGTGPVVIGNATGNVGVGTTTPNSLLNVNGTEGIGQSSITTGANTGTLAFYNSGNTGSVSISAGSLTSTNNYSMILPLAQATATGQVLTNNGSGILSWSNPLGLYTFNNGLTLTGSTLQLGGPLVQSTAVNASASNYNTNFDLGTGTSAGTGTFSVTNGGSGTPYLYMAGNTANNVPAVGIGNSTPGNNLINVSTSAATSGTGNGINIAAQTGASGSAGGNVTIAGGTGGSSAAGGAATIAVGASTGNANGGSIIIQPSAVNGSGATNGGLVINDEGTSNPSPDPSALVDMQSTTSGLLIPRMTTTQMNAISNPATGLTVYTTDTYCFMYWTGTAWTTMSCACSGPPAQPAAFTGSNSNPVCAGSINTYSIASVTGATSYYWIIPAGGGTILSGQGSTSISLLMGNVPSTTISVFAINSCGSSSQLSETITINAAPSGGALTGSASVCSGSGYTYNMIGVIGATSYVWTLPSGWTGTSTTSSISATANATSGNITCTPYAGTCQGSTFVLAVTANTSAPAAPASISGTNGICAAAAVGSTYTCTVTANATSYSWSIAPTTNVSSAGSTTDTNTFQWAAGASGTYVVSVQSVNGCGSSSTTNYTVVVAGGAPAAQTAITGSTTVTGCVSYVYSCSVVANTANYVWSVPAGATITSGQNTTSITVQFGASSSGNVTVTDENGCGNSSSYSIAVTCSSGTPTGLNIIGPTTICNTSATFLATITSSPTPTYSWSVTGASPGSYGNTTTITPTFTTTGTQTITVTATPSSPCAAATYSMTVTVPSVAIDVATAFTAVTTGSTLLLTTTQANDLMLISVDGYPGPYTGIVKVNGVTPTLIGTVTNTHSGNVGEASLYSYPASTVGTYTVTLTSNTGIATSSYMHVSTWYATGNVCTPTATIFGTNTTALSTNNIPSVTLTTTLPGSYTYGTFMWKNSLSQISTIAAPSGTCFTNVWDAPTTATLYFYADLYGSTPLYNSTYVGKAQNNRSSYGSEVAVIIEP